MLVILVLLMGMNTDKPSLSPWDSSGTLPLDPQLCERSMLGCHGGSGMGVVIVMWRRTALDI